MDLLAEQELEGDAGAGDGPDEREKRPPPRTAQGAEREGRVRPGDQEVDRRVVELLQDLLGARRLHRVVERGEEVEGDEGAGEDRRTDDFRGPPAPRRGHEEVGERDEARDEARTVGDGVGDFLALRQGPGGSGGSRHPLHANPFDRPRRAERQGSRLERVAGTGGAPDGSAGEATFTRFPRPNGRPAKTL